MPSILQRRVALVALFGVFLIPLAMSSLRGLTHVLSCREAVETPFTVLVEDGEPLTVVSSTQLVAGEEGGLCGGLAVVIQARSLDAERVALTIPVINGTDLPWRGTVELRVGGTPIPLPVGRVGAGSTAIEEVELTLRPGSHELSGSLLVGP